MDLSQLVQNQAQSNQSQQQQQTVPHLAPSQLPDESYIEKLFPKCQPKPFNQMRGSSQLGNKRMARLEDRQQQQQQKRQSRNKHQYQYSRRERSIDQAQNGLVGTSGSVGSSSNNNFNPNNNNSNNNNNNNNLERNKSNTRVSHSQYYDSSDSSDNELRADSKSAGSTNGYIRRSDSNQFGFDATNKASLSEQPTDNYTAGIKSTGQYSKPRTKKYRASKNLQQQLSRSQSSHSKLSNPNALPITRNDSGLTAYRQNELNDAKSREDPARPGLSAANNEGVNASKPDRGSRTGRGIVFSEPLAVQMVPESSTDLKALDDHATDLTCDIADDACATANSGTLLAAGRHQFGQQKEQAQIQQKQAQAAERGTADFEPSQDDSDNNDLHQAHLLADPTRAPANAEAVDGSRESDLITKGSSNVQTNGVERDQGDEDKFINLFVYDQPVSTPKLVERHAEASSSSLTSPGREKEDGEFAGTKINPNTEVTAHPLLSTGLGDNEQGVISNDTSTEELRSFGDNDADISLKQKLLLAKRFLEDEMPSSESNHEKYHKDSNHASSNKSILKHHRSIGTLQTVDEKAENNIEAEDPVNKTELIDISETITMEPKRDESNVFRKAFVPPGFPQRVRSGARTLAPEPVAQSATQCSNSSPVHVPQTSSSNSEVTIRPSPVDDHEVQGSAEVSEQLLGAFTGDKQCDYDDEFSISSESQSVVEKNLSEALNRVSLDQMIAQGLKEASSANLRHHKIPNEASHFSAVRSPPAKPSEASTVRSSVQFNTLSEGESGQEDNVVPSLRSAKTSSTIPTSSRGPLKRQDTPMTGRSSLQNSKASPRINDELPAPSAKTALVFPRLDEGLSSEAESCDEEAEEDDDKAMDADVDADDDDDEDDADEDAESPVPSIDRRQSASQMSVDSFFRHQQTVKPTNRSMQQLPPGLSHSHDPDSHLIKLQSSAYNNNNFVGDDQINQRADTKSMTNHASQNNGVQPNYWMSSMTNQQATMSSQPTPSTSQFTIQRNQLGNSNNVSNSSTNTINLSRSNSYGNRDDAAKGVNRVSSDTDNETDRLLGTQRNDQLQKLSSGELASNSHIAELQSTNNFSGKQGTNSREVLIEGVLFNVKYLGSTHTECEGRGEKEDRIHQAELAVHEVKFRNGELQSSVEVQLFISTEKIMVLDDKKKAIMMDHSLRTISYIADIGDAIVLIVRKRSSSLDAPSDSGRPISKTSCHVFESNESHTITKSISQAFQVAYTELLKANGGADANSYLPKELDYQEVLNSQEMSMTELEMFARKDNQREVIVPKQVGEILGLSIVESGWGSVLPTAVIASLKQDGPAYRCKKLSVGDQILSINGISLVGLSLAECQKILRKTKTQSVARLSVVPCPITVEVKIKRPDTKYQLGFSVQHGVICSLLRGGIAERGGVRVGHRIISINGTTVVGVPHDKIVTLLASSVGEIRMKTCLTSLYRHMLGEEKKHQWV